MDVDGEPLRENASSALSTVPANQHDFPHSRPASASPPFDASRPRSRRPNAEDLFDSVPSPASSAFPPHDASLAADEFLHLLELDFGVDQEVRRAVKLEEVEDLFSTSALSAPPTTTAHFVSAIGNVSPPSSSAPRGPRNRPERPSLAASTTSALPAKQLFSTVTNDDVVASMYHHSSTMPPEICLLWTVLHIMGISRQFRHDEVCALLASPPGAPAPSAVKILKGYETSPIVTAFAAYESSDAARRALGKLSGWEYTAPDGRNLRLRVSMAKDQRDVGWQWSLTTSHFRQSLRDEVRFIDLFRLQ